MSVSRLVTIADLDSTSGEVAISARHEVELDDGRRILLLDDRGWMQTGGWSTISREELEETTRMVVGPDEPYDGVSADEMAADHWRYLEQIVQRQGFAITADELRRARHDVEPSAPVLARLAHG